MKIHTVSDTRYDEYFGFTDEDVDELLDFYGLTAYKDVVRKWYDGYIFGKINVYCPWDVINYCDELLADPTISPKNYWPIPAETLLFCACSRRQTRQQKTRLKS